MSEFTYESAKTVRAQETFEWDNIWWEHTENTEVPRVLLIGDSISCGYRRILNNKLGGKVCVDGFGSSKAVDNPYFLPSVRMFISQMNRLDMVIFNNGLHGWHLSTAQYKENYLRIVQALRAEYPGKAWALTLTTPVRRNDALSRFAERTETVKERNAAAREIAEQFNLSVLDYFAVVCNQPQIISADGVHLTQEGYEQLADLCAAHILDTLGLS